MALGNKTLEDLLAPISKQLEHDGVADKVEKPAWEFKAGRVTDRLVKAELVDMFATEAGKIRVQVKRCHADQLAEIIASIVGAGEPETGEPCSVVCEDNDRFAAAGVYDALKSTLRVREVTVWDPAKGDENIKDALAATYGITYATGGIAETATIVQPTSPKCGRAISLLPLVHVAVVDAATIEPTMIEAMEKLDAKHLPSQVCFISGPSATADIELVRVEGVHGPMYVHYIIVE